ncbi:MAG: hypothetical protein PHW34_01210 [Hespellia sp.]|nr:hypothetical protein [Hespellia sp.]
MNENESEAINVCEALEGMREDAKIEGEVRKLMKQVIKKVQKGQDCAAIANALEEDELYIHRIVDVVKDHAPEYSEDAIYQELVEKERLL